MCVAFPAAASSSDFQSLVWGVLLWTGQPTSAPIDTGGHTNCFVLATRLLFDVGGFQTVSAFSFYIRTNLQWSPNVYSTIVPVLCTVPISAHHTDVVPILCFQTCPGIHPPLSLHHMLAFSLSLSSCNTMI